MAFIQTCETLPKIAEDEPMFVLRAQDILAPRAIEFWANLAAERGVDPMKVGEARMLVTEMENWQRVNATKLPD